MDKIANKALVVARNVTTMMTVRDISAFRIEQWSDFTSVVKS